MKYLLVLLTVITLASCSTQKNGCGTEKDVQRHDRKPFRAELILKPGTIADSAHIRTTLVSVNRFIKGGWNSIFISDNGDTVVTNELKMLTIGECYLIKVI